MSARAVVLARASALRRPVPRTAPAVHWAVAGTQLLHEGRHHLEQALARREVQRAARVVVAEVDVKWRRAVVHQPTQAVHVAAHRRRAQQRRRIVDAQPAAAAAAPRTLAAKVLCHLHVLAADGIVQRCACGPTRRAHRRP